MEGGGLAPGATFGEVAVVVELLVVVLVEGAVAGGAVGRGATGAGPEIAGRTAGVISGTPSSFAGVVLALGAGADFEVEVVEVAGAEAAGFAAGDLERGAAVAAGWKGVGVTDGVGGIGTCAAAKLNAASDSATEHSGRSTRFM
jgi:hypothetical protein